MGWTKLLNDDTDIFSKKRFVWNFTPAKQIRIEYKNAARLDLYAMDYLNTKRNWWVLAEANNIIFPLDEVIPGLEIDMIALSEPETLDQLLINSELETITL